MEEEGDPNMEEGGDPNMEEGGDPSMEEGGDPNMEEGRMISLCGREETINQAGSGTLHHDCDQEREGGG
jgi:hypothetical protein